MQRHARCNPAESSCLGAFGSSSGADCSRNRGPALDGRSGAPSRRLGPVRPSAYREAPMTALVALVVGFGSACLGAFLARHYDRQSRSDTLLAEALDEAVAATSEVAHGVPHGQARYASAVGRIALHGPPRVVEVWRAFQDDATTETDDGRARMVAAVQAARKHLRHGPVSDTDLHVLLFGPGGPRPRSRPQSRLP